MEGDALYSIGELARHAGLTVKAVRFYSDRGIVPPAGRTPAGYRRYGGDAVARLALVRTLRDLGLGLAAIRQVVQRELSLSEVAEAHAEALAVQIDTLRLRRAVLTAVARRGATPEETALMHRLAQLSEDGRRRLIEEFLDAALGDAPALDGIRRTLTPQLPEEPDARQVEAWLELAELTQDSEFRAAVRQLADGHRPGPRPDAVALVREQAGPAVAAGIDPVSAEAAPVVEAVLARCRELGADPDEDRLAARLAAAADPRRERYLRLLAVVNGWPAPQRLGPVLDWFLRALAARRGR
jgi:DNA-binding transcriptional MerR regulator